jgi:hypothetical protein
MPVIITLIDALLDSESLLIPGLARIFRFVVDSELGSIGEDSRFGIDK